jgi:ABC-2 type transport system permease protein
MLWRLFAVQLLLFLREPFAVFFTLLFPLLLVVILGYAFGHYQADPGYRVSDENVPVLMATILATLGLLGLPVVLAEFRAQGVLKRYRASPITMGRLMGTLLVAQFAVFLVAAALTAGLTWLLFGLRLGGDAAGVAVMAALAAAAVFALGFLVGGLARSARTAQAIGFGLFFPMLFLSGAMIPREELPGWLRRIGDFVPLTYAVDGLRLTWIGEPLTAHWLAMAVLAGLLVACAAGAARTFRWE